MQISKISICNQALVELGADTISSLNESTTESTLCSVQFDPTRRELLRLHPWNCALKYTELALQANKDPNSNYNYQFKLPSDFIRLISVNNDLDYKIIGTNIHTNKNTCFIKYVFDNEDVSTWESYFIAVFVLLLKSKISYPITKTRSMQEMVYKIFLNTLEEAKIIDGSEDILDQIPESGNMLLQAREY